MELEALQPGEGMARQRNRLQNDCDGGSNEVKDVYRDCEHDALNKRRDNRDPIPDRASDANDKQTSAAAKVLECSQTLRAERTILTSKSFRCCEVGHFP